MVIFIDDLDRCSKENVVDILEAMNFLSVSGDCYIVLGMDETWVKICIENNFPDMVKKKQDEAAKNGSSKSFADNYLEKMINIPVPIPSLKQADTMDLLLPEAYVEPLSLFQKVCQSLSEVLMPYRVLFSMAVCAVAIGAISYILPENMFLAQEKNTPEPAKLYQWDNVSVEHFSVTDGEPEIQIAINESEGDKQEPINKVNDEVDPQWQLVLEGDPNALKNGIEIASFGDKKNAASLLLKKSTKEKRIVSSSISPDSPSGDFINSAKEKDKLRKTEFLPGDKDSLRNDYWLPLVSLLLFGFGLIVYSLKIPNRFVRDSANFEKALSIWQPWIGLQRSTPRAIKRYVNYVRYLAMRYKNIDVGNRDVESQEINEENLVALSAIHAIEPAWLTDDDHFDHLQHGILHSMIKDKYANMIKDGHAEALDNIINALEFSIEDHKSQFGSSVFSKDTVDKFLAINASTKFN